MALGTGQCGGPPGFTVHLGCLLKLCPCSSLIKLKTRRQRRPRGPARATAPESWLRRARSCCPHPRPAPTLPQACGCGCLAGSARQTGSYLGSFCLEQTLTSPGRGCASWGSATCPVWSSCLGGRGRRSQTWAEGRGLGPRQGGGTGRGRRLWGAVAPNTLVWEEGPSPWSESRLE